MSISESDVRHVASLSRVGLDSARLPLVVAELNGILGHMDALQRVDVSSNANEDATRPMMLADDVVGAVQLMRSREDMAPAMRDGFFVVPRLATHAAPEGNPAARAVDAEAP